ncbi:hypothetical protein D3C80_1029070 [compost metagenome]
MKPFDDAWVEGKQHFRGIANNFRIDEGWILDPLFHLLARGGEHKHVGLCTAHSERDARFIETKDKIGSVNFSGQIMVKGAIADNKYRFVHMLGNLILLSQIGRFN